MAIDWVKVDGTYRLCSKAMRYGVSTVSLELTVVREFKDRRLLRTADFESSRSARLRALLGSLSLRHADCLLDLTKRISAGSVSGSRLSVSDSAHSGGSGVMGNYRELAEKSGGLNGSTQHWHGVYSLEYQSPKFSSGVG
jgi:hypothetical protein